MSSRTTTLETLWIKRSFDPNDNQRDAITHVDGPLFLTAGPGSGKTRVLLWRTLRLKTIYGVSTKSLNLAVKRNVDRFPSDFTFRLTGNEFDQVRKSLRLQFETSKTGRGGRRYLPNVFTEHGAIMLASVLNSPRAVEASIYVVRAFVRLRNLLSTHKRLAQKLGELEERISKHDADIQAIVAAIRQLMEPPPPKPKRPIGFHVEEPKVPYRATRKKT